MGRARVIFDNEGGDASAQARWLSSLEPGLSFWIRKGELRMRELLQLSLLGFWQSSHRSKSFFIARGNGRADSLVQLGRRWRQHFLGYGTVDIPAPAEDLQDCTLSFSSLEEGALDAAATLHEEWRVSQLTDELFADTPIRPSGRSN